MQLTRDLFAIAKFLYACPVKEDTYSHGVIQEHKGNLNSCTGTECTTVPSFVCSGSTLQESDDCDMDVIRLGRSMMQFLINIGKSQVDRTQEMFR